MTTRLGRVTNRSLIELANYRTRVEDVVEESNFGIKYISGVANINLMLNASSEDLRAIQRKIINAPNTITAIRIAADFDTPKMIRAGILFFGFGPYTSFRCCRWIPM